MAENINIDIIINAANAAKTLKEQKDALKDLNKALDEVKQGSGAFELLTESANELKSSMDTLTLSFEDVYGEGVQPLTTQLGELEDRMYALASAGQQNTEEFKTLQAEAIRMRKTIIDVDDTVDAFAQKGARLQGFIGIAQGITGAFATAKGALSLFGVQSEAVEKSLASTAAVIEVLSGLEAINTALKEKNVVVSGIQNGIRAVTVRLAGQQAVAEAASAAATGTATTKQIALNAAMKANPIGLLITAVLALTAAYALLGDEEESEIDKQKRLNEQYEKDIALTEQIITASDKKANARKGGLDDLNRELELLKAKGATELEINEQEKKILTEQLNRAQVRFFSLKDGTKLEKQAAVDTQKTILDLQNSIKANAEQRKIIERGVTNNAKEEAAKRKDNAKKEADALKKASEDYNKQFLLDTSSRIKAIEDLQFQIEQLRSDSFSKQFNELKKGFDDELEAIDNKYTDDIKALREALDKKIILEDDYNKKKKIIGDDYNRQDLLIQEKYNQNLTNLLKDNFNKRLDLDLDISKTTFDNRLKELEKLERLDKEKIDATIKNSSDKEKAIKDTEFFYFNERKIATENFYKETSRLLKANFLIEKGEIEKSIKESEKKYSVLQDEANEYYDVAKFNEEELTKVKTDEDKKFIQEIIDEYKKKGDEVMKVALLEVDVQNSLNKEKTKLEVDYNKEVISLTENTTDKINEEEQKRTKTTKEELEKRIKDWEDFATQASDAVINLFGTAFNSITEARVQGIDRAKEQALASFDKEYEAYQRMTDKKTNAEQAKFDKEAEFAQKRADIEAKFEKQKAEAIYKNEIRQWEFSLASAAVNLANALLKSAPNPILFGTTTALGILQLATINANKPLKTFGKGGLLDGPSHANGGIATPFGEMEGGEAVINKKSVSMPGVLPILSAINEIGGGVPLVNTSKMANGAITNVTTNVDTTNIEQVLDRYFNRPIKTYVVANDVTAQQLKDSNLNDRVSF
jgi:hypothetical protein